MTKPILSNVQPVKPFSLLATVYDALMGDIDYDDWGAFILRTIKRRGWQEGKVLDLGCGTGNSTYPMFVRGLETIGLDFSDDMLEIARQKLPPVTFVKADFKEFSLGTRFTLVYSVFDSLNNLLTHQDFMAMANCVHKHLKPKGFFMFDVNTSKGLKDLWESGVAEGWAGDVYYRWDHSYDETTNLAKVEAYCENEQISFTEVHYERPYDAPTVKELLKDAGFINIDTLDYPEGETAPEDALRIWVVAQKP